jgi:hypothetical protein
VALWQLLQKRWWWWWWLGDALTGASVAAVAAYMIATGSEALGFKTALAVSMLLAAVMARR